MKIDLNSLLRHPVGKAVGKRVGLQAAPVLRRGRELPAGPIALAVLGSGARVTDALAGLGIATGSPVLDTPDERTTDSEGKQQPPRYPSPLGALVIDATGVDRVDVLEQVRALLRPAVRGLEPSGRIVVVATTPEAAGTLEGSAVAHALMGIVRSVARELRAGATANLLWVHPDANAGAVASSLRFFLEGRSAYVDGQPLRIGPTDVDLALAASAQPFERRIVVVTGAARGIGAAIARVFARDGAAVVAVDVPAAGAGLSQTANATRGTALQLDITAADAGERIAAHVAQRYGDDARIYALVHNAGILRDRMIANLDELRWGAVLEVNLLAHLRINERILDPELPGGLADGGRLLGLSSTSGVAGNRGQTNYAASKAGVMGWVQALAPVLAQRGITVNAVAPGFIETDMTAGIPFVNREMFRRSNSLLQGGQPVDVAETLAFLADPASAAISGQVLRVCGQAIVGA